MSSVHAPPIPPVPLTTTPSRPTQPRHANITSLDGLRGLAILLVVWCHIDGFVNRPIAIQDITWAGALHGNFAYWEHIAARNAAVGVQLFFVLSGFLLFLPYARTLLSPTPAPWPSARLFYSRRARRILPAYLPLSALGLIITWMTSSFFPNQPTVSWGGALASLTLLYDVHQSTLNLATLWDGALWSLTVEWQFYLMLPLLAWGLARARTPRRILLTLGAVVLYGLAIRGLAAWAHYGLHHADPTQAPGLTGLFFLLTYGVNGRYLEVFALGMLTSVAYVWGIEQRRWTSTQQRRVGLVLLATSILGVIVCSLWATFPAGRYDTQAFFWSFAEQHGVAAISYMVLGGWIFGLAMAALLFAVLCLPTSLGRLFTLRPLVLCGIISYSLYLWHMPLLRALIFGGMAWPAAVLIVTAASAALYAGTERPWLHHRSKQTQPAPA